MAIPSWKFGLKPSLGERKQSPKTEYPSPMKPRRDKPKFGSSLFGSPRLPSKEDVKQGVEDQYKPKSEVVSNLDVISGIKDRGRAQNRSNLQTMVQNLRNITGAHRSYTSTLSELEQSPPGSQFTLQGDDTVYTREQLIGDVTRRRSNLSFMATGQVKGYMGTVLETKKSTGGQIKQVQSFPSGSRFILNRSTGDLSVMLPPSEQPAISPLKQWGMGISQWTADQLGLSRTESQELYAPVDTYGDTGYREKLLSLGVAEPGVSVKDISTFLVQAPSYVGLGASTRGISSAIKLTSSIGFKSFKISTGILGGIALGYGAYDIATTESKTQQQWKAFTLIGSLALFSYGMKPSYYGYNYPSTHFRLPKFVTRLQRKFDTKTYGGFTRQKLVSTKITDMTNKIMDTDTGRIIGRVRTNVMGDTPVPDQTITGYKGWSNLKQMVRTGYDVIGDPTKSLMTESGYKNVMKYLVTDYGKPSKFSGFSRLESGTLIQSTEASGYLMPRGRYSPVISSISRTSPGKTLYWSGEMVGALNTSFFGVFPIAIPLSFSSELTQQATSPLTILSPIARQRENILSRLDVLNVQIPVQLNTSIQKQGQLSITTPKLDVLQVSATALESVSLSTFFSKFNTTVPVIPILPRLGLPGFPGGGIRRGRGRKKRGARKRKHPTELYDLLHIKGVI